MGLAFFCAQLRRLPSTSAAPAQELAEAVRVLPYEWLSFFKPNPMTPEDDWRRRRIFDISVLVL